jgi:hypothetical protein
MARACLVILEKEIRSRRIGIEPQPEHRDFPFRLVQRQSDAESKRPSRPKAPALPIAAGQSVEARDR